MTGAAVVRIGVIGTGIGVAHIEALQQVPGAVVVAVCSARPERAAAVAARFAIPRATTDYRDLLGPDVDAVVVASPPALHLPMGLAAIAAGKHIFCEKPLAMTLADARALRDAAQRAGVVHLLNYQMRFTPPYARAWELLQSGDVGRLTMLDVRSTINPVDYLQTPLWSTSKATWFTDAAQSGGLLASSAGPHLADLLRWFAGPVEAVAARTIVSRPSLPLAGGGEARDISAEDGFLVLACCAGGVLATMRGMPIGYHSGGFSVELNGLDGSLAISEGTLRRAGAADRALAEVPLPTDAPDDRVAIATRFVTVIRAGGPAPAPNFDDGVASQAIVDAAIAAAERDVWVPVEQA